MVDIFVSYKELTVGEIYTPVNFMYRGEFLWTWPTVYDIKRSEKGWVSQRRNYSKWFRDGCKEIIWE